MVKIMVIKFDVVEGKKVGKSLSFLLNPVEMAVYKSKAKVMKFVEEYVKKSGVFVESEMSGMVYEMDEFLAEWRKEVKKLKELEEKM